MNDQQQRLAFFIPSLRGGGAERVTLNLAQGIAERGYAIDLVLTQAEGVYLDEVPNAVQVVDLKASRVLTSLPALVRYLRRERPQTMLSSMTHANIIALWTRRLIGIPKRVVVTQHITLSGVTQGVSRRRVRLMQLLIRLFYPWADGIVTVSTGVADDLQKAAGLPRQCIQIIYNPVVTPELREKAQAPLQHPWFNPGQPPVLLGVGRLTAQKDFPTLIQAFAQVRQTRSVRLLILGEGEDRPSLEALVRQLGLENEVSLPGFVSNPYAYLSRASLFVLSSRWEGLPTVLIEALYCGVPLVSTDCPSGPREILADGLYGQLVPVGDVAALAQAIEMTLEHKKIRTPDESWRPFELETAVNKYVNLLMDSN